MRPASRSALLPVLALVLTACGGGGGGSASAPAGLSVTPAAATVATTPQSTAGNTKQFTASAAVTWTIQEASGGTITAAGLYTAPATEGTFHVIAAQQGDATKTATATVTVMAPPAITTQPTNQAAPVAGSATFTVAASGQQLAYQWKRNGTAITGATSASYQLTNLTSGDSGATFQCTVTNPVGSVESLQVLLSVQQPVSITSFTASPLQVEFGGTSSLAWTLSGTPSVLTLDGANALGSAGATVSPRNRQTYTLSASGGLNTDTKTVTVAARGIDLFAGVDGGHGNLNGKGDQARFWYPMSIVCDPAGNAYHVDQAASEVRKIAPDGTVSTLAGAGLPGFADGDGATARFSGLFSLGLTPSGDLLVVDRLNNRLRKVTTSGVTTTLAGPAGLQFPYGACMAQDGTLYVVQQDSTIKKIPIGGAPTLIAGASYVTGSADGPGLSARFYNPYGILVDPSGNCYVSDTNNHTIRRIAPDGTVSTLAGLAGQYGYADGQGAAARFSGPAFMNWDKAGTALLVADQNNGAVRKVALDGTVTTLVKNSALGSPMGAFEKADGTLVITDSNGLVIHGWNGTTVSTLAGKATVFGSTDGPGLSARFGPLQNLVMDASGNAYVAEASRIRKITPGGVVSTLASGFSTLVGIAVGPDGNLVVGDNSTNRLSRVNATTGAVTPLAGSGSAGDLDGPAASATFTQIQNVAVGPDGTVYVAQYNGTIRKLSPGGTVSTLAGSPGTSGYVDAQGSAARFANPAGLAVDAQGNVLVGEWFGSAIRKIAPDGTVSTWVGGPGSAFVDGPAATARFDRPIRLAVDAAGNVYVCDLYNQAVRKVAPNGTVTTLVGSPSLRGTRPGALPASIYFPYGIGARANGDLLVATESAIMAITAP